MSTEPTRCLECGAALLPGQCCRDLFDACMAKEFEAPAGYGSVHHLSVLTYMLQHLSQYSRRGWMEGRKLLVGFVRNGESPQEVRRQNRPLVDSGNRTWSVTRGERLTELSGVGWSRTIADVRLGAAEEYCADVRQWAEAVLSDTEELRARLGPP